MAICRFAVFLFAAQSLLSSAAVVHHANLRAESAEQKVETVTFSEHLWNNTMTRLMQNEILMVKADPPKVDKVFYVFFAMFFGMCGCDRCFMGQVLFGCLKGFTLGGFFVWHIIDYFVAVYCALSKMKEIDMMGYHATFKEGSVGNAFYVCIALLAIHFIQQMNARAQMKQQQEMQAEMLKNLNQAQEAQHESLNVPVAHQALAHVPTVFSKVLRKAGVVNKEATIPELIASFKSMDKDGDGQLDHDEIKQALTSMGVSDEDVDTMIKEADADNDGKISQQEFLDYQAKKAVEKAAKKAAKAEEAEKAAKKEEA